MTGGPTPPARQPLPAWDDALGAGIALVEAFSHDDAEGIAALPANASLPEAPPTLTKVPAEEHQHYGCIADGSFRAVCRAALPLPSQGGLGAVGLSFHARLRTP